VGEDITGVAESGTSEIDAGAARFVARQDGHLVQFYDDDGFLCDKVGDYILGGLAAGEPVIVIATEAHRLAFVQRLVERSFDVQRAQTSGQLTLLDARETLSKFMVGMLPDWERFRAAVGAVIEKSRVGREGKKIRAYGEMVDLLWKEGNRSAAIRLEHLWNDLGELYSFSLFCAYSMRNFAQEADADQFHLVCHAHSHVLPTEQYARIGDADSRLREVTLLQQRAGALSSEIERRKRLERALRCEEERLRAALSAAAIGTYTWDLRTNAVVCDEGVRTLFGFSPRAGTRLEQYTERVHPGDRAAWLAALERTVAGEDFLLEYRVVRPDGSVHWVLDKGKLFRDEAGASLTLTGAVLDVTERKAAEEERARLLAREKELRHLAETANRAKDEFLAVLSHELRTPLTAMLGWARLLRGGKLDPTAASRAIEVIERNATAQAQLINDILDVSRIITGKLRLEVRQIEDVRTVIEASLDALRPAAVAKSIQLEACFDPLGGPVSADPDRIQQVVWNLISNAIKFTPKGGRIEVTCSRVESQVEIAVRDNGKGITPDFLPCLFERFRQEDGTSARLHGGLGLGLALVRHLCELHGGTVQAESDGPGCGSCFRVRLPLLGVRLAPRTGAASEGGGLERLPNLEGVRILAVDDDADTRLLLTTILRGSGAEVRTAESAPAAMTILESWIPDVLLSDVGLPEEDGYAFIRRVRALPPEKGGNVAAAALTAYAGMEDRRRALGAGFQTHAAKPIDPEALVAMIAALVGRARV
jgi:PAS domain S-box-containing protein